MGICGSSKGLSSGLPRLIAPSIPTYPEIQVVFDIPEKAAYHSSKMDDMGGPYLLEQGSGLCCIPEGSQDVRGPGEVQGNQELGTWAVGGETGWV